MEDPQRQWIERAERYGEQAPERPEIIYYWAQGCSTEERAFFSRLYEDRPGVVETEEDLLREVPPQRQRDEWSLHQLSRRAQYLVTTAYQRIWMRDQPSEEATS